jgi:hypothetical protein
MTEMQIEWTAVLVEGPHGLQAHVIPEGDAMQHQFSGACPCHPLSLPWPPHRGEWPVTWHWQHKVIEPSEHHVPVRWEGGPLDGLLRWFDRDAFLPPIYRQPWYGGLYPYVYDMERGCYVFVGETEEHSSERPE